MNMFDINLIDEFIDIQKLYKEDRSSRIVKMQYLTRFSIFRDHFIDTDCNLDENNNTPILYYLDQCKKKDISVNIHLCVIILKRMVKKNPSILLIKNNDNKNIVDYQSIHHFKRIEETITVSTLFIFTLYYIKKTENKYTYNISQLPHDIRKYLTHDTTNNTI